MAAVDMKAQVRLELDSAEVRVVVLALRGLLEQDRDVQLAKEIAETIDRRRAEVYQAALEMLNRPGRVK